MNKVCVLVFICTGFFVSVNFIARLKRGHMQAHCKVKTCNTTSGGKDAASL
jgi:hypothetical protein